MPTILTRPKKTRPPNVKIWHNEDPLLSHIRKEVRDDSIIVLTFDHPDSLANIFDSETLSELENHIDDIALDSSVRGLVLTSAKCSIFLAGADLKSLAKAKPDDLQAFIEKGQRVFEKIAKLKIPTASAIHGACLGGGLEMALACDIRVTSPDKATKIGLPETQLGIIPAWGGCTRLPKLIGIPAALKLILTGKPIAGRHARKIGLVDSVAPREHIVRRAIDLIQEKKHENRKSHFLVNNIISATIIRKITAKKVAKKTRGNYPAQIAAIEIVTRAPGSSAEKSLARERDAVLRLNETDAAKNLTRLFFLTEKAKKFHFSEDGTTAGKIERTAVIGAGVMGAGIAQWFAARDYPVILSDIDHEAVANGLQKIDNLFSAAVNRHIFIKNEARLKRDLISPITYRVPLHSADLVVEAAVENLEVKKKIFADLCERTRPDTILATNTSALPITDLATAEHVSNPGRVIGLHFFNPVHQMKLVEIVVTKFTAPEIVESTLRFVRRLGKLPVVVNDSPGFVVNRILMPYLIEAGQLFNAGVDAREIDEAMLDFGMPMGPLRLLDEIGLDVAAHVARTMGEAFGDRFAVPSVFNRLVDCGQLGRKTGAGFFDYSSKKNPVHRLALESRTSSAETKISRHDIAEKLAGLMVTEAEAVLAEGVARSADDIDFAMILGTGFAPFRGGPLHYKNAKSK